MDIDEYGCAWTATACRKSQEANGRGDDCPDHPWGKAGVTLVRGQSINLTTGVVTEGDVAPANVALDNLGVAIAKGLKINNLRALHLAIMRTTFTPREADHLADSYR